MDTIWICWHFSLIYAQEELIKVERLTNKPHGNIPVSKWDRTAVQAHLAAPASSPAVPAIRPSLSVRWPPEPLQRPTDITQRGVRPYQPSAAPPGFDAGRINRDFQSRERGQMLTQSF